MTEWLRSLQQKHLSGQANHALNILISLALLLIFVFDAFTPLGFAHGMLYVPIIFIALLSADARIVILVTLGSVLLTLFGIAIAPSPVFESSIVLANRLVTLLVIAVSGALAYWTLILKSIQLSQRRRLTETETELAQVQRMESIGQLTGGMAHDFNNVLTVVMGNADLLSDALRENENLKELADTIIEAAERGASLNRSLLAFARRQALSPVKTDIGQLVYRMHALLERSLGEYIRLKLTVEDSPLYAIIEAAQLESAILNLSLNARDAMPGGGDLNIEVQRCKLSSVETHTPDALLTGDYIQLTLTDTGTGVPEQFRQKIFEPFFTTKPQGKGSGLGLSMVFGFVKQSSGYITLESEPDQSSRFQIYLPAGPA